MDIDSPADTEIVTYSVSPSATTTSDVIEIKTPSELNDMSKTIIESNSEKNITDKKCDSENATTLPADISPATIQMSTITPTPEAKETVLAQTQHERSTKPDKGSSTTTNTLKIKSKGADEIEIMSEQVMTHKKQAKVKNKKLTSKHINNDKGSITTLFDAMKRILSPEKDADTPRDKQEKNTQR